MKPVYHSHRMDAAHAHKGAKERAAEVRRPGQDDQCPRCGRWFKDASRKHRDRDGIHCVADATGSLTELPPVNLPTRHPKRPLDRPLPDTDAPKGGPRAWGHCEECDTIVSGERRFCGICLANRMADRTRR